MIKHRIMQVAAGLMLAGASTLALAEPANGWYFGVSGGQASPDLDQQEFDAVVQDTFASVGFPVISGSSELDDTVSSFSAFAGYRISPYASIEASYLDLGSSKYTSSGLVNPPGPVASLPASYSAEFEVDGFTVSGIGSIPLGTMFELHGQLGVLFASTDITTRASISTDSATETFSADSQDFFYGIGGALHLGTQWSINLDWHQFKDVGDDDDTGESDVDRISLGVVYRL